MKETITLLIKNTEALEEAVMDMETITSLPYYSNFGTEAEREKDLQKAAKKIDSLHKDRIEIIEKLEAQIKEEKKALTNVTAA